MSTRRGRGRRLLLWAVPTLLLLAAAVAVAPSVLAPYLSARLSAAAGVPVRVEWLSWNPFAGRVALHRLSIALAPETPPVVTVRSLVADVGLRRFLAGDATLSRLVVNHPWVDLRRTPGGDFNVAALLRTPAAPGPTAPEPAAGRRIHIGSLRITGGSIEFRDETTAPALETSLHLEDVAADGLTIALSGPTNVELHLASRLEQQPLTLDLEYHASGDDSRMHVGLATAGVSLARTLLYVPLGWQQVSGTLDLALSYAREVRAGKLRSHALTGHARARDITIAEPGAAEPNVRAASATLAKIGVDFVRRRTDVGPIAVEDYRALIARDAEGVRVPFAGVSGAGADTEWRTEISEVTLGKGEILLRDVIPAADAELRAQVGAGSIRTVSGGVNLRLATTTSAGPIDVEGRVGGTESRLRFTLRDVALPELADRLRLPLRFATGSMSGTLDARLSPGPVRFTGTLQLPGGRTVPPDAARPHDVVAWQNLTIDLADAAFDPLRVHVRRLDAEWPYVMIHRAAGGLFPATLFSGGDAASDRGYDDALRIDAATLRNGRIEFYDTTLTPPYWTELTDAAVTVSGLAAPPLRAERITVAGAIDEISPAEAQASIDRAGASIKARVTQLRLPPLNPYLEPLLQYEVTSGAARIDSDIHIKGSELQATNDLVLSRIGLARTGDDAVQRELGTSLSVALALMKDHRGDISLALPITGDLAAGKYEAKDVASTALTKALVGALRSPVTLLGSVFRRDEGERFDLRPVPFPAGSAELTPEGETRVAELARLLGRHTELDAVLIGEPSPADATFFRDADLLARLAAGPGAGEIDAAVLTYLRARHAGASPAPLAPDAAAALRAREDGEPQANDRLTALAAARTRAVIDRLTTAHRVPPERIGHAEWEPGGLRAESSPGVDIQLRGR